MTHTQFRKAIDHLGIRSRSRTYGMTGA